MLYKLCCQKAIYIRAGDDDVTSDIFKGIISDLPLKKIGSDYF